MKQTLKKFIIFAVLLFLTGLVFNVLINNPYSHRMIRGAVAEKVEEYTNLSLDFEALSISMIPLQVTLYGVQVSPESKTQKTNLFSISHVQIKGSWWNLMMGKQKLKKVHIHDLDLEWPPPPDFPGFLKKTGAHKEQPSKKAEALRWPPAELPLEEFEISNGRFKGSFQSSQSTNSPKGKIFADLAGFDLKAEFNRWKRADLTFKSLKSQLYIDDDAIITNTALSGELTLQGHQIEGQRISIKSDDLDFQGTMKGNLNLSDKNLVQSISVRSHLSGEGDLKALGAFLNIENTYGKIKGNVATELLIPLHDQEELSIQFTGHAKSDQAVIYGFNLFQTETDFSISPSQMTFDSAKVYLKNQLLATGDGYLGFSEDVPFDFDIKLTDLPLSNLLKIFEVSFPQLDFNFNGDNIRLLGQGDPFKMSVNGKANLSEFKLPEITYPKTLYPDSPGCDFDLSIHINSEKLTFPKATGQCFHSSEKPGTSVSNTDDSELNLISSDKDKNKINLDGFIGFSQDKGLNVNISADSLSMAIAEYFLQIPALGEVNIKSNISGPYSNVITKGKVSGKSIDLYSIPLKNISSEFSTDGKTLAWNQLRINPSATEEILSSKGGIRFDDLSLTPGEYTFKKLSPQFIHSFIQAFFPDQQVSFGIENAHILWSGPFLTPALGLGRFNIEGNQFVLDGEDIADHFEIEGQLTEKNLTLEPFILSRPGIKLSAATKVQRAAEKNAPLVNENAPSHWWTALGFQSTDYVTIKAKTFEDVSSNEKAKLPWISQYLEQLGFQSNFSFDGQVEGPFDSLQGHYSSQLNSVTINGVHLPPVELKGFLSGDDLSLNLTHSGNSIEGRFSVGLKEEGLPYHWYLQFKNFDMRAFATQHFFKDPRNFAYISGSWSMEGHLNHWWSSRGALQMDSVNVRYSHDLNGQAQKILLQSGEPSTLMMEPGNWHFKNQKPLKLTSDGASLTLGLEPSSPPEHLSFHIRSEIEAFTLTKMFSNIEGASGKFFLEADLKGPAHDLALSGRLYTSEITNHSEETGLNISVPDLRPEFRNLQLDVRYQNGYLDIKRFQGTKGTGTLVGSGQIKMTEKAQVKTNVNLNIDQIKVVYPVPYLKSFDTILSGELQMSGDEKPWLIAGDIRIEKSRSTRRFDIREEVVNVIRKDSLDQAQKGFSEDPFVKLNINFLANQSISIHNSSMQLTLSSELRLQGDEQKQVVLGHVEIQKGKFIYKREFDIRRGELTFDDPTKTDPKLDIVAVANVSPYKVTVAVNGAASRPVVELLVDPPTRDDGTVISRLEAILLLTRGSLPRQEQHSAEATGLGISEVLSVYASQVPFDILSEKFGQDYIHVYPDITTDDSGSPVIQLNVPIKIYNDIEAVYRQTLNKSEISLEVPVHNNISLSGSFDEVKQQEEDTNKKAIEQGGSVDLQFRFPIR